MEPVVMKSRRTFDTMESVQSLQYLLPPSLLLFYFLDFVAPAPAAVDYYVPLAFGCLLP
jgi:hypothetical protein